MIEIGSLLGKLQNRSIFSVYYSCIIEINCLLGKLY